MVLSSSVVFYDTTVVGLYLQILM